MVDTPAVGLTGSATAGQRHADAHHPSRPPPTPATLVDTPAVASQALRQRVSGTQTHITPGLPPETVDRLWLSGAGGAVVVQVV
jgi:hypothetical protein